MRLLLVLSCMAVIGCQRYDHDEILPAAEPIAASSILLEIAQQAEHVAARDIFERFPNSDITAVAICIRGNATDSELLDLSEGTLHNISDEIRSIVDMVLARVGTQTCIADNGASVQI